MHALHRRLGAEPFHLGWRGWTVPLLITVFAGILRFSGISTPHRLVFDETYYAKDAYALLLTGYELTWPDGANEAWVEGTATPGEDGDYVVHPPLGKWLIAIGIRLFGMDTALGWRFSAAVAGTLAVLLIALIAQRMFRSVFLGAFAGILTAIEGHHLVMSRLALLDIFLMLFVLAAFGALLADRYGGRRRLADLTAASGGTAPKNAAASGRATEGPWLLFRPWRLLAAVLLGCAVAVKLSALAFIAVFGIMVVLWDLQARRALGERHWIRTGLIRDAIPAVLTVLPVALLTYILSWSGWLFSTGGWGRLWHLDHPAVGLNQIVPGPLRSLWHYHVSATEFHEGLDSEHEYASTPWTWLFMGRPVSMHYQSAELGEEITGVPGQRCEFSQCSSAVLDLANPVIWWAGLIAVVLVVGLWLGRRDWRYGAILSGYVAGYLVWLLFPDRTMFFFYTIAFHPFLILAIVATAAVILRRGSTERARRRNTVILLMFVLVCVAASIFFWPIWTAEVIPQDAWRTRIWIDSWL